MHYIFLVHGMGNWDGTWSDQAQEIIKRHYKKENYAFLGDMWPFEQHFKFEEINYNHRFEQYLEAAKAQGGKLGQWDKLNGGLDGGILAALTRIVDIAKKEPDEENFAVSHLADVALYMATNLGELVKNDVLHEITERLEKHKFSAKKGDKWSVIAHSLGTRVITEVLQHGFTDQPGMRNYGKAQILTMVANVSKLLQGIPPWSVAGNVYKNEVYPSAGPLGACWRYINCTHALDPFAVIREFDPPPDFGDGNVFLDEVYHPIRLAIADTTSKEVHSLEHYLEHPQVHTTLFRYLISLRGRKGPTRDEMSEALKVYRMNTIGAQVTDAWRDALDRLKQPSSESFASIFELWERYGALLK